jgi:hypothetical protein
LDRLGRNDQISSQIFSRRRASKWVRGAHSGYRRSRTGTQTIVALELPLCSGRFPSAESPVRCSGRLRTVSELRLRPSARFQSTPASG